MSEKSIGHFNQQYAHERYSVAPLQNEIDDRFQANEGENTYNSDELRVLCERARRQLKNQDSKDDVYYADVFVVVPDDQYVYYVEPTQQSQITRMGYGEEFVIHGYVYDYCVKQVPDNKKQMLVARVEEIFDDSENTQTYYVPIAVEGSNEALKIRDAPVPVGESSTHVVLDDIYAFSNKDQENERIEQDVQLSLLNIIEQDLFDLEDGGIGSTRTLGGAVGELRNSGFIDSMDDFATACNYYFMKCAHDNDAVYLEIKGGEMLLLDGPLGEEVEAKWIDDTLELIALDFTLDDEGIVSITVYCTSVTEDGVHIYKGESAELEDWAFKHLEDDD